MSERVKVTWRRADWNTCDYVSECGRFVAIYHSTHCSGYATYHTYAARLPKSKRTAKSRLSTGGLPEHYRADIAATA